MSWKYLCDVADIDENTVRVVDAGGVRVAVARYAGGYRVMPPVCPHMEQSLDESGVIANCVMTCTKHLWSWDLRTMAMLGETEKPLATYEVREEAGRLMALIDHELTYEFDGGGDDDDDFFG